MEDTRRNTRSEEAGQFTESQRQMRESRVIHGVGMQHAQKQEWTEAIVSWQQAVAVDPEFADAHGNLGVALQMCGRLDEAIAAYRRAVTINANLATGWNNLGGGLFAKGELDESIAALHRATKAKPDYAEAFNNLGRALQAKGMVPEAIAAFQQAAAYDPTLVAAHYNEGLAQLLCGNFGTGWQKYEMRWDVARSNGRRVSVAPQWRGEQSLAGKSILLSAEQGLGDTLQFIRYVPLVAQRGATVYVEVQPLLKPLLRSLRLAAGVYAQGEPLPEHDFQCPLLSLPLAFRTELATIPREVPYVQVAAERIARWKPLVAAGIGFRVGVIWSGNPNHRGDRYRSIPLLLFRSLFATLGCHFFILQKDIGQSDRAALAEVPGVTDLSAQLGDFADTAAIIKQLDLVISVDTAGAHLAGALGAPTWILVPFAPDWRWLLGREDSPWYPSARLFRQPRLGDWATVIQTLSVMLAKLAGNRSRP